VQRNHEYRLRVVAAGSIPELRQRTGLPQGAPLEDVFVHAVQAGAAGEQDEELLTWLTGKGTQAGEQ